MVLVGKVKALAEAKGVTAGQLALAWVHAQGDDVFPIPGDNLPAEVLRRYISTCHYREMGVPA